MDKTNGSMPRDPWSHGFGRSVTISLVLHAALFVAVLTLVPVLHELLPAPASQEEASILRFRFRTPTAPARPEARTETAPETPFAGAFAARARDPVPGEEDTPVPATSVPSTDSALPGAPAAQEIASGPVDAPVRAAEIEPADPKPGVRDRLGSEVALLTGREARRGRGAVPTQEGQGPAGALAFGDLAFSTWAWDFEPYWHHMRQRLYAHWHPPAAYRDYGIIPGGWTTVRAVLDRDGRLRRAAILGERGHASLHPASLAAMIGAAPFRSLPASFPEDSLAVTVRFIYMPPPDRRVP